MKMVRRKKRNEPGKITLAGNEYYSLAFASERLGMSCSKLAKGLHTQRFPFKWAKLGDDINSRIYVLARDVEVYKRQMEKRFEL